MQHNLHSTFKNQLTNKSTFFVSINLHHFRYNMMKIISLSVLLFIAVSRVNCTTKKKVDPVLGFYVTDKDTKQPYASTYEEALAAGKNVQMQMYNIIMSGLTEAQRVSEPKYFIVSWFFCVSFVSRLFLL